MPRRKAKGFWFISIRKFKASDPMTSAMLPTLNLRSKSPGAGA